jgi:hypothetical protein
MHVAIQQRTRFVPNTTNKPPSVSIGSRLRLKRGGTQLREEGGLKGKQANGVGTQLMKRKRQVRACPELLPTIKTYMLPSSMVGRELSCNVFATDNTVATK